MAENADTIDYRQDYYRGFSKIYFNKILNTIINFGDLKNENGIILDYGCGRGHLKKRLGLRENIINYDIIPELSEVKNYRKLSPNYIILSGVLEHLNTQKTKKLVGEFQEMNPKAVLIIYIPTENIVSKIAMRLAGMPNAHDDHVSDYKSINRLLEKHYRPVRRKYIFFHMAQITRYEPI